MDISDNGPCCTTDCRLRFGDKCRDDNGCRDASFCDGRAPYCPPSINKPNKTICNQELVCFMGECTGSICLAYGLESCQCIPAPEDPPTKACELCCRLPGENQPCLSSFDWNTPPYDIPDMFAKPGTPCNDYNGYCDVFQKCREVDPSGPLATLRKLLLSDESLATFRRWLTEHWYAATLIVLAAISILVISAKLLRKRPGKKLKSVTIIHSSTTETVRLPPEGAEGVTVHPPAVRAKLPLSKKVREKRRRPKRKKDAVHDKSAKAKRKRLAGAQSNATVPTAVPEDGPRKRQAGVVDGAAVLEAAKQQLPAQVAALQQFAKRIPRDKPSDKLSGHEAVAVATGAALAAKKKSSSQQASQSAQQRKKKEVIDYSAAQADKAETPAAAGATSSVPAAVVIGAADPKSKVRSWLLASHCRVDAPVAAAAPLTKSKSSPMNLQANPMAGLPPRPSAAQNRNNNTRQVTLRRLTGSKSRSVGNLARNETTAGGPSTAVGGASTGKNERARLQVVYKPPFKFTVKLRKADKVGQAAVAAAASGTRNNVGPRTGVLVRAIADKRACKERKRKSKPSRASSKLSQASCIAEPASSDLHTVPSDLEVLLSESEFLFSDT